MNGIHEKQTFDFALIVSLPILTPKEKAAAKMRKYRSKLTPEKKAETSRKHKEYMISYMQKNRGKRNAYLRKYYAANPEQRRKLHLRWATKPDKKEQQRIKRLNDPVRNKARNKVTYAIKKGLLVRPPLCQSCGNEDKTHAHHTNYSKALDVMWLCPLCHKLCHKAAHNT